MTNDTKHNLTAPSKAALALMDRFGPATSQE